MTILRHKPDLKKIEQLEVAAQKRPFALKLGGASKCIQSHAEGTTAREIVERYAKTGELPPSKLVPQFFDASKVPSLLEALNFGAKFNTYFSTLPAQVRDVFKNNPQELMEALRNPKQKDVLMKLGILSTPKKEKPVLGSKENPIHTAPEDGGEPAPPPQKGAGK